MTFKKLREKLYSESHWRCNVMSVMGNVNDSNNKQIWGKSSG